MSVVYESFKKLLARKSVDLKKADVKACLVYGYKESPDHNVRADVPEIGAGGGYKPGGLKLTGKRVDVDESADVMAFSADPLSWPDSHISASGVVLYLDNGSALKDQLVCYLAFPEGQSSIAAEFRVEWGPDGILNWSWW